MTKYRDMVCRLHHRKDAKVFLGGDRYCKPAWTTEKSGAKAFEQRNLIVRCKVLKDYREQPRKKQKVKRIYFVFEKQFQAYFQKATRQKCFNSEDMLFMLERRSSRVVYHIGFSILHRQAIQLVNYRHIRVNEGKLNILSPQFRSDDKVAIKAESRIKDYVEGTWNTAARHKGGLNNDH